MAVTYFELDVNISIALWVKVYITFSNLQCYILQQKIKINYYWLSDSKSG